jgi:hypothetical protein
MPSGLPQGMAPAILTLLTEPCHRNEIAGGYCGGASASVQIVRWQNRDKLAEWIMFRRYESGRTKVMGSAGVIGTLLGAAAAGQCMIWAGMFRPGTTPNEQILNYWPGFLIGAVLGGVICFALAMLVYSKINLE